MSSERVVFTLLAERVERIVENRDNFEARVDSGRLLATYKFGELSLEWTVRGAVDGERLGQQQEDVEDFIAVNYWDVFNDIYDALEGPYLRRETLPTP